MEDVSADIRLVLGLAQYNDGGHALAHPNSSSSSLKLNHASSFQFPEAPSLTLGLRNDPYGSPKVSTDSNSSVKREYEDMKESRLSLSRTSDDDEATAARKKLRLNKEQSALLEEKFKQHTSLNPKQKQALAKQLNLRPRQVEVWFQNRRARTKLKQTETDCEVLKRCCERLTEENQRLKRELEELKMIRTASTSSPLTMYMQMPVGPTLTMCPSCNCVRGAGSETSVMAAGSRSGPTAGPFARPTKC